MSERQKEWGYRSESESELEECESRKDCKVKRRDKILSEKNEQRVSKIGREWS